MRTLNILHSQLRLALRTFAVAVRSAVSEFFVSQAEPTRNRFERGLEFSVLGAALVYIAGKHAENRQPQDSQRNRAHYQPRGQIKHKTAYYGNQNRKNQQRGIQFVKAVAPLHKHRNFIKQISHITHRCLLYHQK